MRVLCILMLFVALPISAQVWVLPVKGVIGPATSEYVISNLKQANAEQAELVILELDTPGGLDSAMRDIIQTIIQSPIPVVTYVSPSGARAASAGTFILMASHVAAMAPGTNLGAASPVSIGMPTAPSAPKPSKPTEQGSEEDSDKVVAETTLEKKVLNDAIAYIRSLAELHGRNADWAEKAVSEAASLAASAALEQGVIDLIADNRQHLLQQLQDRQVSVLGQQQTLSPSTDLLIREPNWRQKLLAVITNPNVAYILMLVGIYGLILEFYNPGVGLPGVLGAISLLVAMYALQMMPLNYVGLGLMLLGIVLMVTEALSPSFGLFGIGGVIAFALGSTMLMDSDLPGYQIALPLILGVSLTSFALFSLILSMLLKIRRKPATTGDVLLTGTSAIVIDGFPGQGRVRVGGEIWKASCEQALKPGQNVVVTARDGFSLNVSSEGEAS